MTLRAKVAPKNLFLTRYRGTAASIPVSPSDKQLHFPGTEPRVANRLLCMTSLFLPLPQVSVVEPKDEPLVQEPYSEPKEVKQMQPMGQTM